MYRHWEKGGVSLALEEVRQALHGEDLMKDQYAGAMDVFDTTSLDTLIQTGDVIVVENSPQKLHVLNIGFANDQTGNMFFVVHQAVPVLLHFGIQASGTSAISPLHVIEAEARADEYWTQIGLPIAKLSNKYGTPSELLKKKSRTHDGRVGRRRWTTDPRS
jgi:hypothetical protein